MNENKPLWSSDIKMYKYYSSWLSFRDAISDSGKKWVCSRIDVHDHLCFTTSQLKSAA